MTNAKQIGKEAKAHLTQAATGGSGGEGARTSAQVFANSGFALSWWGWLSIPVTILIGISGWVVYRFRETRALTLAQWVTFRTLYPLMSLHDPVNFARIVRGMINIQQHEGVFFVSLDSSHRPVLRTYRVASRVSRCDREAMDARWKW